MLWEIVMRQICFAFLTLIVSSASYAAYDSSWYKTDFWSGEYPAGVAVVRHHVQVMGRTAMDRNLKRTVKCALPYKAVFHPWNDKRNRLNQVRYFSATKIIPMTAKEDFSYVSDTKAIDIKKGDTVEYLNNFSEGSFAARYKGVEFGASQDLFDHLENVDFASFQEEDWLRLRCENGVRAWLAADEIRDAPGFGDWGPGLDGYGKAHDLP